MRQFRPVARYLIWSTVFMISLGATLYSGHILGRQLFGKLNFVLNIPTVATVVLISLFFCGVAVKFCIRPLVEMNSKSHFAATMLMMAVICGWAFFAIAESNSRTEMVILDISLVITALGNFFGRTILRRMGKIPPDPDEIKDVFY